MSHSDLILRIKEVLLPLVATDDQREALLIDAFYLSDSRLFYEIDRKGAPGVFASLLLRKLIEYGGTVEGRHPAAHLLAMARFHYGVDRHAAIDALIAQCESLGAPPPDPAPKAPASISPAPVLTIDTPRAEQQPTVFISYARVDAEFAGALIAGLQANGHACWIDTTSIQGGDEWITTIAEGIRNSYAVVVVVTRRALKSRWVRDEILWARKRNKPIIPLLLEDVSDEPVYFPLIGDQPIPVPDRDCAKVLPRLLQALASPPRPGAPPDSPPPMHSPVDRRKLELAYLERLRLEELLNTDKYTPLAGASQQQRQARPEMKTVFELLPIARDLEAQQAPRKFEDAVAEIRRLRRAVLLGEPGGGKTTTIWKLAADFVATAIEDRDAAIPLLLRLGRWTMAGQSLPEFIAAQLGDLGAHLKDLLCEGRAALLLDGLNELPVSQRAEKYPQVQQLIEQHPKLLAVVSCRELDYTVDLGFDRINITPLDPLRIREFADHYLEEGKGEALFWKLAGPGATATHQEFMKSLGHKLSDPDQVFWMGSQLPADAQDGGYGWSKKYDWAWRRWIENRERPSSLMVLAHNPYMLLMLTSVYADLGELPENRGELFRLFAETLLKRERIPERDHAPLTEGLAKVAYAMQIRRAGDKSSDALTVLPREDVDALLGDRMLYLAGSASLLSVGEQVRFTHQLLQEYFAARYMDLEIRAGRLKATQLWPLEKWWERTNWEEATVLLAGLYSDDCSRIVEWAAEANPEVAAMCIVRSGAAIADATKERMRSKWLPRLTDLKGDPEPKARAAVGRALGMTGLDNRKGVGTIIHEGVALPEIDWVEIPAGEFQYGEKKQKLTLPTFHIARYPVTYAQFQTFLNDPEGFADPRWFEGLAADEDDRRMEEQSFQFANHPRETVKWYQAMAFCRWYSWRLGGGYDLEKVADWAVRLPTEFEWENAARGTDGRIYPYKGEFDAAKGNIDDTGIGQTSAVGIFPNGASPYGVMDMSGNVWEWCLTDYRNPAPEAQGENLQTSNNRVLRGGSWFDLQGGARAVVRHDNPPAYRVTNLGFRLVLFVCPPSL